MLTSTPASDVLPIKPNILIAEGGSARLTDFMLAPMALGRAFDQGFGFSDSDIPTMLANPDDIDPSYGWAKGTDCYALGMVIYQVLAGRSPFGSLGVTYVMSNILRGEHPERPRGAQGMWFTDDLWELLGQCWEKDPESRPSIKDVDECLERVSATWKPLPSQGNMDIEGRKEE